MTKTTKITCLLFQMMYSIFDDLSEIFYIINLWMKAKILLYWEYGQVESYIGSRWKSTRKTPLWLHIIGHSVFTNGVRWTQTVRTTSTCQGWSQTGVPTTTSPFEGLLQYNYPLGKLTTKSVIFFVTTKEMICNFPTTFTVNKVDWKAPENRILTFRSIYMRH